MTSYLYTVIPVSASYSHINNAGQVFSSFNGGVYNSSDNGVQTITYPNSSSTTVYDVNDSGQVLGIYTANSNPVAFVEKGGTYTALDIAPAQQTAPLGLKGYEYFVGVSDINNSGEILGSLTDDGGVFGYVYSGGVTTLLPDTIGYYPLYDQYGNFDSSYYPTGTALNDAGDIIGSYYTQLPNGDYQKQGFLLTGLLTNGIEPTYTPIVDPSGVAGSTDLLYINSSDQIIGDYSTSTGKEIYFLYHGGAYTDIVGPSSAVSTTVKGINDQGDVVGEYTDASGGTHGFIYDSGTGDYSTIDYKGTQSGTWLTGINNSGQVLGYNGTTNFIATPAVAPTVIGISATPNNGTYISVGRVVTITVNTSEVVTVSGTPTLQLNDNETAKYQSGSGTKTLTFVYTVQKGDTSPGLQVTGLGLPSGAAILDQVGDALSGPVTQALGLVVDTNSPVVIGVTTSVTSGPAPNKGYAVAGDTVEIDVAFSDAPLLVPGTPVLKLGSLTTTYASTSTDLTDGILAFDYTVASGQKLTALKISSLTLPKGIAVTDQAGNVANLKLTSTEDNLGLTADGVPPTVKSAKATSSSKTIVDGSTVTITLTTSEAVTVTGTPSLNLSDGATASYASGSGGKTLVFTYHVGSETSPDLQIASINGASGITDAAGNALSSTYSDNLKLKINPPAATSQAVSNVDSANIGLFANYLASFAPTAGSYGGHGLIGTDSTVNHPALLAQPHN